VCSQFRISTRLESSLRAVIFIDTNEIYSIWRKSRRERFGSYYHTSNESSNERIRETKIKNEIDFAMKFLLDACFEFKANVDIITQLELFEENICSAATANFD